MKKLNMRGIALVGVPVLAGLVFLGLTLRITDINLASVGSSIQELFNAFNLF